MRRERWIGWIGWISGYWIIDGLFSWGQVSCVGRRYILVDFQVSFLRLRVAGKTHRIARATRLLRAERL